MFFTNYKKQVNEILSIIEDERVRHKELLHIFIDAAKDCSCAENRRYNYELADQERMLMALCDKLLDKINKEF